MDGFACLGVDGMSNIRMEARPIALVSGRPVTAEAGTALVAVTGPEMVLFATLGAPVGELPAGHRHEEAFGALDDADVPDDDCVIDGNGTERL